MWRILLCLGMLAGGFSTGWAVHDWKDAAGQLGAFQTAIEAVKHQGEVNTLAAAAAAKAQAGIRTVTKTQIKEVPVYVDAQTDRRFPLPVGWVRVHDAAALGLEVSAVPDPAGRADGQASTVTASDSALVIAANYGECRADQDRLKRLQDWLAAQGMGTSAPP